MSEINVNVTSAPITASVTGGDIAATVAAGGITAGVVGGFGPQGPVGPPGTTSWNGLTDIPATFPPSFHTHVAANITDFTAAVIAAAPPTTDASLLTSGTLADARLSANVVLTNDARLSDARTPTAHTHTSAAITDFVTAVIAAAPPTTDASLLTSGTLADARLSANVVFTGDSRLSDARTPTAHTHTAAEIIDFNTAVLAAAPKPSLTLSGGTTTPLVLELSQAVA